MKKVIFLFMFILTALWLAAQAPDWLWVKQAGGSSSDSGRGITTDGSGNSYVVGNFEGAAIFGTTTLSSSGDHDIFIAKLDNNGNYLWAKKAGGTSNDSGIGIASDNSRNSYVTGYFFGTATFGSTTLTSSGDYDIFIAKLDTNGNWLWAKQAGGTNWDDGWGIYTDSSGNSYVTGNFSETATFGTTTLTSNGDWDIFIGKLDTNGNWLWAKKAGGTSDDIGRSITASSSGNSYVTGDFTGTVTFGSTTLISSGIEDTFIAKLDTNGNYLWAKKAGGSSSDFGSSIAIDSNGNCYVSGSFAFSAYFGTTTLSNIGNFDVFIAKLDTSGNFLWARQAGGIGNDYVFGIATDSSGNSFVSGLFNGTATYGSTTFTSSGETDIFIAKLDTNGNYLWAKKAGGSSSDFGSSIATDSNGNSYVTGSFGGASTFGTATFDTTTLTSSGMFDIYIAKLNSSTGVSDEYQVPQANFSLGQNHPNPFITSTSFEIDVNDAKSIYEVSVYDLRGRHICTLHQGVLPAGKRTFTWNGKDASDHELSSGVYLYRVSNGATSQVKKMIYVK